MELNLNGRKVLVTGASRGIGRATALALAAEGCDLVLVSRTQADLERVQAEIRDRSQVAVEIDPADLSVGAEVRRLAGRCADIDILVNNAGAIPGGQLQAIDEATWRDAWDLKVFGYVNMCRAFYAQMKDAGGGTIINIVGNAADTRDPDYICGVTGNAALAAFTQSLGSASWRDGIRVLAISPGPVATERMVTLMRRKLEDSGEAVPPDEELFRTLPFGRAADPQEIASAVSFLASERSGYTSGTVVTIDAGLSVRASFT